MLQAVLLVTDFPHLWSSSKSSRHSQNHLCHSKHEFSTFSHLCKLAVIMQKIRKGWLAKLVYKFQMLNVSNVEKWKKLSFQAARRKGRITLRNSRVHSEHASNNHISLGYRGSGQCCNANFIFKFSKASKQQSQSRYFSDRPLRSRSQDINLVSFISDWMFINISQTNERTLYCRLLIAIITLRVSLCTQFRHFPVFVSDSPALRQTSFKWRHRMHWSIL